MKRIIAMLSIAACFAACSGGNENAATTVVDSVKRAGDSIKQTGDTSALNKPVGDTTSASGIHGAGSGSEVGGGKTGAPQKKSGSAK